MLGLIRLCRNGPRDHVADSGLCRSRTIRRNLARDRAPADVVSAALRRLESHLHGACRWRHRSAHECITDTGGHDRIEGVATVVDTSTNARLRVVFDNFFARLFGSLREGNYWILALDPEYQTAMVGTPDRRFLWILSRSRQLDEPTYQRLVEQAKRFGFPISDLIRTRRPAGS